MGQEIICQARFEDKEAEAKASLEGNFLIVRSEFRLKLAFDNIRSVEEIEDGWLLVDSDEGRLELRLGEETAAKWIKKILNPPSRLDKLGVKAGLRVAVVSVEDQSLESEINERGAKLCKSTEKNLDVIFFGAQEAKDLGNLQKLKANIAENGAIWIIYPKGVAQIKQSDVFASIKSAAMTDIKVASFSETHTALKAVIPVAKRGKKGTLLLMLLAGFLLSTAAAFAETTAIKAGSFIDVESGKMLSNQIILIEDGKFKDVGANLAIPSSARIIDLSKYTVMPGLIDCHTHLVGSADPDPIIELQKTSAQRAFESIPNARKTLEAGFTTVRDVGCYRAMVDLALRDAINRGDLPGPRMFAAGAYLTISKGGGALTGFAPDVTIPWDLHFGEADDPWTVRKKVRQLAHYGVDLIKLIATGAVLTHGSNPGTEEFTPEEMQAAVDEANKFGLRVAAHAHGVKGIKDAIKAGVASIEHGTYLDDEAIELMKQHGTYLVADIYDDDYIMGEGKDKGVPKDFQEHESNLGKIQRDNFTKAVKAGVKVAFGTDAGVFPHGWNGKQFAYMVKYGLSPMQSIQSATIWAADLIGKSEKIGSVKAGKYADLVAVEGDPLKDIHLLEHVSFVMKDGKICKQ